jgi:hypothetical protein
MSEGPEKVKEIALLKKDETKMAGLEKQKQEEEAKVKERDEKIDQVFQELGDPINYTSEQFNNKADTPRWKSLKN